MSSTSKPKPRPIVRLGILLISHSFLVSVICCVAGVIALLILPILAKNTYISENALMPGSANPMLSNQDVSDAERLVKGLMDVKSKSTNAGMESQRLIAKFITDLGAEVGYHKFCNQSAQFHPLNFFSGPDSGIIHETFGCASCGTNVVGIVRAPRGDGKESIVLVTPYDSLNAGLAETLSLGIVYSVFSLLTRVTWLAKDIVWLVADSQYGEYAPVAAWLRDYYTPSFSGFDALDAGTCNVISSTPFELNDDSDEDRKRSASFRRAGTMAAALVLKVVNRSEPFEDSLSLYAEASNGQMPNLDLINIVNYLAVHRQGLRVKVKKLFSLLNSKCLGFIAETLESVGLIAKSLNPQWKFGLPASDYIDGVATLASSLYHQALGIPTGSHGAFRDFQVDAVTLEFSPKAFSNSKGKNEEFLLRGGRLIEGVIRSVNNLLEKFHQSFFLYLLTSPSKFVSVGVYMIAFALIVAPLPVVAASLFAEANKVDSSLENGKPVLSPDAAVDELFIAPRSWLWLREAKKVLVIHVWGTIVSLLPYFIYNIPHWTPASKLGAWALLSTLCLLLLHVVLGSPFAHTISSQPRSGEWVLLKSVTISATFIGLCLMSVINFATAEFGALLIVPICLMVRPLLLDLKAKNLRSLSRASCNLVMGFVGFPPAIFFLLRGAFDSFQSIDVLDFWNWVESLWAWNSATYLYIGMVHLPCWVLCLHILLYPC